MAAGCYQHDLVKQAKQVLYDWRNDTTVNATLGVLEQALFNVGRGAMCLKTVVENRIYSMYSARRPIKYKRENILLKISSTNSLNLSIQRL
jgi:hypothetical protein